MPLRIPGFHRLRRHFPEASARDTSCDSAVLQPRRGLDPTGLGSSPVARHYWGNHFLFSLPRGTKMFQFPRFASIRKYGYPRFTRVGCPIRRSADQRPFAPPRGLSQLVTSFIACESQGIRHAPFPTFARNGPATQARLIILSAFVRLPHLQIHNIIKF